MGGYDAKCTSIWKTRPSTATEMPSNASGKLCTNDLKKERGVNIHSAPMATSTHLIAPTAVLGLHCPTSFPSSFPARAVLCTLNGHRVNSESKNHVKIWT